jgi:ABC-type multidrug transport system fused ATPase/permease subunit
VDPLGGLDFRTFVASGAAILAAALALALLLLAAFAARRRARRPARTPPPATAGEGLGGFVRPYRWPLALAAVLALMQGALDLAAPWPLKLAVDHAIGGRPLGGPLAPLGALDSTALAVVAALAGVALVVLGSLLAYLTSYLVGAASAQIEASLRTAAFERLLHLPLRVHDRHRTGDLVARLTSDVPRVQDALVAGFTTVLPKGLSLAGMLAILVVVDLRIALAALVVVPALTVQILLTRRRITAAEREVRTRNGALAGRATETVRHVRAVQAFGRERVEGRLFRDESDAATRAVIRAVDVDARFAPVPDLILSVGGAFILLVAVQRVLDGAMTVGLLLVVLTYAANVYHPIRSLTRLTTVLARAQASRERLREILSVDAAGGAADDPSARPAPDGAAALRFDRVTFGYRPGVPVLRGATLEVAAGTTLCLVGPTGAGKSTLLSLALRFYEPDEGAVTLGGLDLRRLSPRSLRSRVALVPQDAWIVDGTIADNIRFGRPDASDADVTHAARVALVDEIAGALPHGYETRVGEGGAFLSGGQRRRVALARALLRDARVLLLDEPTSGLDAESEAAVIRALRSASRGRTVLIVSHRLRIAAIADRVAVLRGGTVVEDDEPARLLAAGGAFARLWVEQGASASVFTRAGNGRGTAPDGIRILDVASVAGTAPRGERPAAAASAGR